MMSVAIPRLPDKNKTEPIRQGLLVRGDADAEGCETVAESAANTGETPLSPTAIRRRSVGERIGERRVAAQPKCSNQGAITPMMIRTKALHEFK